MDGTQRFMGLAGPTGVQFCRAGEIGEEIALLNERILQAALQGALGVG